MFKSKKSYTKTFFRLIADYFFYYCKNSSLHGFTYVGDKSLSLYERIFWVLASTLGIYMSYQSVYLLYTGYLENPILITYNPDPELIENVPFPTVTICHTEQLNTYKCDEFMKTKSLLPPVPVVAAVKNYLKSYLFGFVKPATTPLPIIEDFSLRRAKKNLYGLICNTAKLKYNTTNVSIKDIESFLKQYAPDMAQSIRNMKWCNKQIDVDVNIDRVFVGMRPCIAINYMDIYNGGINTTYAWDPEMGFKPFVEEAALQKPFRTNGPGVFKGLTIVMDSNEDALHCPYTPSEGFTVSVTSPIDNIDDGHLFIRPGRETWISMQPTIKDADPGLLDVPIERRHCYFQTEKRKYAEKSCLFECDFNTTLSTCGCVTPQYFNILIRFGDTDELKNVTLCDERDEHRECIGEADILRVANRASLCKCLPACYEISYSIKTVTEAFYYDEIEPEILKSATKHQFEKSYFLYNVAIVQFFFAKDEFVKQTKNTVASFTELLSNIGGLLGLFMGFSFLTLIEMIYYTAVKFLLLIIRKIFTQTKKVYIKIFKK